MGYLTVTELKNLDALEEIKISLPELDIKLQNLIDYCSSLIDFYVGSSFLPEINIDVIESGEGENYLSLTKRIYLLNSVCAILDNGSEEPYNINTLVIKKDSRTLLSREKDFYEGDYNIKINGNFGWEVIPNEVKLCTLLLCNFNFSKISSDEGRSQIASPFKRESIGNYSYELKSTMDKFSNSASDDYVSTGLTDVDKILDRYRNDKLYIGVV